MTLDCALQVVRRSSKGKDPESPTTTRSHSSAGSSDKVCSAEYRETSLPPDPEALHGASCPLRVTFAAMPAQLQVC